MSDIKRVWANPESLWVKGRVKFVEGVELVYASDYDAAQAELAALREELAIVERSRADELENYNALIDDMKAAEQRNAELVELLTKSDNLLDALNCSGVMQLVRPDLAASVKACVKEAQSRALLAALNHTNSGESHDPS